MNIHDLIVQCETDKEIETICLNYLIQENPGDQEAIEILFDVYMRTNNFQEAFKCADTLWELNPTKYAEYGLKVADGYLASEAYDEAYKVYKELKALNLNDDMNVKAEFGIAQSYLRLEDLDKAQAGFENILLTNKDSYACLCGLAVVSEQRSQYEQAFAYLDQAKSILPDHDMHKIISMRIQKKRG